MSEEPLDSGPLAEVGQSSYSMEAAAAASAPSGMGEVARASGVMAVGTMVSRITGVLRDTALGAALGTAVLGDTFAVANTIPNTIYALLAGGAISAVFVPQLVRHLREDEDRGEVYTQRLLTLATVSLLVMTVLAVALAPLIVRLFATPTWTSQDFHVATMFAVFCLPQILFYGLYTMFQQVLNARGSFAAPMFSPILNNVVVIVTCGLFLGVVGGATLTTSTITSGEITLLGVGTTAGIAVQALVPLPVLRRTGFRWRLRFDFRHAGLGRAGALAKWTFVYVATSQVVYVIIARLATRANTIGSDGSANVGFVSYQRANLVFQLPQSVITLSVVTALLPALSAHAIGGDLRMLRRDLMSGLRLAMVGIVPATAALLVLAPQTCLLLFGWGSTTPADALAIGSVTQWFVLGLVPYTVFFVLIRGFFALEDTKTPALVNIVLNVVNIGLAALFFVLVSDAHKVQALAAAYLPSYLVAAVATWVLLSRRIGGLPLYTTVRTTVRLLVAVLPAALLMWAIARGATSVLGEGHLGALVGVSVGLTVGFAVFAGIARRLRVGEVGDLVSMVRGRLAR